MLKGWPEAIRAILLATADFQGADGLAWSPATDGKDGAGLTNASAAVTVAGSNHFATGELTADNFNKIWTFVVPPVRPLPRVRVALSWNSKVADAMGVPVSSELDADLDLVVRGGPKQKVVAESNSFDSSIELVDFVAPEPGIYFIQIKATGTLPSDFFSHFGIAWYQSSDSCP
jgi:hypothetical protein